MVTVDDVAAAVLERTGPIDTFKLQKLVYYCQAWHLVWDDEPLFMERIEAWAGGPVVRALYDVHRGKYAASDWPAGDPANLTESELETVEVVVDAYGKLTGRQLSQLTHAEAPWRDARGDLAPGERGNRVIDPGAIQDYYSGIDQNSDATSVDELVARPVDASR
ncbi:MAG: Panacea domain-containing protein [Acidimicrobiales bacterium]